MGNSIVKKLSTLDRFLPVWIFLAMALGLGLGRTWPGIGPALDRVKVDTVSLPIAIGLLWMMYPVLAKVRYGELGRVTKNRRLLGLSLVLNWLVGPVVMFALAWLLLPDLPHYRDGLILIGLATRFSALALLGMTATIQLLVYPDAWPTHGVWAAVLLYLAARGPGTISLDHLIARRQA